MKKVEGKLRRMEIEVHRGPTIKGKLGEVTGHTVHHYMEPTRSPKSESGAFMDHTHHSQPFSKDEHDAMIDHVNEHLEDGE
jgi:hypothetical protein